MLTYGDGLTNQNLKGLKSYHKKKGRAKRARPFLKFQKNRD